MDILINRVLLLSNKLLYLSEPHSPSSSMEWKDHNPTAMPLLGTIKKLTEGLATNLGLPGVPAVKNFLLPVQRTWLNVSGLGRLIYGEQVSLKATTTEPAAAITEAHVPRICAPQQEKSPQ